MKHSILLTIINKFVHHLKTNFKLADLPTKLKEQMLVDTDRAKEATYPSLTFNEYILLNPFCNLKSTVTVHFDLLPSQNRFYELIFNVKGSSYSVVL